MIANIITNSDADFVRSFIYKDTSLVAINLTGSALRLHVRAHADDATAFMELSTENGLIQITDAVAGKFKIRFELAQLSRLPIGSYVHSLIRTIPVVPKLRETVWRGTLTHQAGPTRWK